MSRSSRYRIYSLNKWGELNVDWLDASDDETALEEAHQQMNGAHFEIWYDDRMIGEFKPGRLSSCK